jgi:CheY-like chemotaxis protein
VSTTRLLVIADSKMLPALANGLREGGRFEVAAVALSDRAGAQAAAEKADAVALFYGAPGAPLPAALQMLSPRIREHGGRIVAVLQREQAAQRDDCFRAGASDVLFMPVPKDQFMARLQGALELSWAPERGAPAPLSVATRKATSKIDQAMVSPAGVETPAELPLKAGETVRLSWGSFQSWGLVVQGKPSAQIRFAGLAPDEEAQIRDWLKGGGQPAPGGIATPPGGSAPSVLAAASPGGSTPKGLAAAPPGGSAPPGLAATPPGGSTPVASRPLPPVAPPTPPEAGARAAPASGPPPGFADRKPVRPQSRVPARVPPKLVTAAGAAAAAVAPAAAAGARPPTPPGAAPPAAPGGAAPDGAPATAAEAPGANGIPAASPALSNLFSDAAAPAPATAPAPAGPPWPAPVALEAYKTAAMQLLRDKRAAAETPKSIVNSARKITGMLGSAERAALERGGSDSHLANALAVRIAMDAAISEGLKLYKSASVASVDAAAVAALTKQAEEAAARLQTEANAVVGKAEVASLQMITAASAALSRDTLSFRETADRLRGLSAAPRLGGGALDPDLVLPGQQPRPVSRTPSATAPVRADLRDFRDLDNSPGRGKTIIMAVMLAAFLAALAHALYFSLPQHKELSVEKLGKGIERVDVSGPSALVTVSPEWLGSADTALPQLVSTLREAEVTKAILMLPNGNPAGVVDVATGKVSGLARPKGAAPPK